ncbi:PIN domain-containing protein [Paracoccus isoporae]|uniref:PIN domain-containing protein n=1 Tax=Paracoccus isoporae TaxID=591205 RepID=A0A1G7A888_9RHOB|nr:PIN domain-containing protein [Paracoccus isoporae]SDE10981.1 PIN domain-containing protein [Paracoccus isoporae]
MRAAVLDACVLFPTVLREILCDVAAAGLYRPVWSERILVEWTRAAARLGPVDAEIAGAEAARLRDRFPGAAVDAAEDAAAGLDLPDPADRHVVATALQAGAGQIVTFNLRDFPRPAMAAAGLHALHPDAFLTDLWAHDPDPVARAAATAHAKAERLGGAMELRALMKRARLPRLGKALSR